MTNKQAYAGLLERAPSSARCLRAYAAHYDKAQRDIGDDFRDGATALEAISSLLKALEVGQARECGTWCDPSLNEHTSYCKAMRAALNSDAPLSIGEGDRG